MIKIGILGDIGSGKSYVAKQFGFPVFDADVEVAKIYKKNRTCFNKLKNKLPKYIFSFPVKKSELGKAIIDNQSNLKKIIKIVHPIVRTNMNNFFKKNKNKKIVVLDIPLLMENKINKKNYILVFVDAKKKEIQKRLRKRPNYNPKIYYKLKSKELCCKKKKKSKKKKSKRKKSKKKRKVKVKKVKGEKRERKKNK